MYFDNDYDRLINDILAQLDGDGECPVIFIDGNDYDIPGLNELLLAMGELMLENEEYADACFVDGDSTFVDFTDLSGDEFRELENSAIAMMDPDAGLRGSRERYLS